MFDFSIVTQWFDNLLSQTLGLSNFWTILIECVVVGLIVLTLYALIAMFMIYFERKVCAFFQCRLGPMRVGKWGIFQVVADVLKMLIKEIFGVDKSDKVCFTPSLRCSSSLLRWAHSLSCLGTKVLLCSTSMSACS